MRSQPQKLLYALKMPHIIHQTSNVKLSSIKITHLQSAVHLAAFVLIFFCLLCCSFSSPIETHSENSTTVKKYSSEDDKARALFNKIFYDQLALNPVRQTYLGIKTDYDKWNDISEATQATLHQLHREQLRLLEKLKVDALNEENKLNYRLMEDSLERLILAYTWRLHNYPISHKFSAHTRIPAFLINQHSISNIDDANAYIARLRGVENYFDQIIDGLVLREAAGIIPPRFVFPYVIESSKKIISGQPFDSASQKKSSLLNDFSKKIERLDIGEDEKLGLIDRAQTALNEFVLPAYQKLITHVEGLAAKADDRAGVWKFPDGDAYYDYELARRTTTKLSAREIHQLGLDEVARLHSEIRDLMATLEYDGDLSEFFAYLRDDPRFYYPNNVDGRHQYLKDTQTLIRQLKEKLPTVFFTVPNSELSIKRVEAFREKSAGKAFYQRPAPDGTRPGTYYVNLYDMKKVPRYQMEALTYHEALPGHHFQLSIAQETEGLPEFRKYARFTAYSEGWGLYAEWLPKEMGFYQDPLSDAGRLAMELWRACRLVVDTGIHHYKWTREQAIEYLRDNTPNSDSDIISSVERYIVLPGQATAYKIGMIKIQKLREKASAALQDAFDLREFHQVILRGGAMPLTTLEQEVDRWIGQKTL